MEVPSIGYGYLDESSSLPSLEPFFVTALLVVGNPEDVFWKQPFKRARRIWHKTPKGLSEWKFNRADGRTRELVLEELARGNFELFITIVDKEGRQIPETPANYGLVVGQTVVNGLERYQRLAVVADRKYTNATQERAFQETVLRLTTTMEGAGLGLALRESQEETLLQLADFVAGAFSRKYNRGDSSLTDRLVAHVAWENVYAWTALKAQWRGT